MNECLQGEWYVSETEITGDFAKSGKYNFNRNGRIEIFETLQSRIKFIAPTVFKYQVLEDRVLELTYSNNTKAKFDIIMLAHDTLKIRSHDHGSNTVFCRSIETSAHAC